MEVTTNLFREIKQALWLLDDRSTVLARTKKAEQLQEKFQINLTKIIEISQGKGCALHSTKEECLNCPLEGEISANGFPFVLLDHQQQPEEFWGSLQRDQGKIMLQIEVQKSPLLQPSDSMFNYLNNARENERKKIAQDLHDGIAQSIYSLMLETRNLKWIDPSLRSEKLKEIDHHFSDVLKEVKDLAGELRPMTIDEFGLVPAIEQFVERTVEMTGFEITLSVTGKLEALSENSRISTYRIIQEAVGNSLKYSGVNQVELTLNFTNNFLHVLIEDQGEGFDLKRAENGFGLINMQERAHAVAGELNIISAPHQGTKVILKVPIKEVLE